MNCRRIFSTAVVIVAGLASASAAIATTVSTYRAGSPSHPPYVKITAYSNPGGRSVGGANWSIKETCAHNKTHFISESGVLLGAKIDTHGHFSKTVHPLDATVSGTISGNSATVKVQQSGSHPPYGNCHGSDTLNATKV